MVKKYDTEDSVKRNLNVQSLVQLRPNQYGQLAEMIPNMSPELATSVMNQVSSFVEFGKTAISTYTEMCNRFLEENEKTQNTAIQGYQLILDGLSKKLDSERISEDERAAITRDMIEVANDIAVKDKDNKEFLLKMADVALKGLATVAVTVLASVGGKVLTQKKEPEIKIVQSRPRHRFPF